MKMRYLAAAVLGALPALGMAQTNVTMFGLMDGSVNSVQPGGGLRSHMEMVTGMAAQSRLGFFGTEDLGGGLYGRFHIEMGLSTDTGLGVGTPTNNGSLTFSRTAFVGLRKAGVGTFMLGHYYTPGFLAAIGSDVAAEVGYGYGLYGTTLLNWLFGAGVRWSNAAHFVGDSWGGLVLRAAYSFGHSGPNAGCPPTASSGTTATAPNELSCGPSGANKAAGIGARYDAGPLMAHAHYHTIKSITNVTTRSYGLGGSFAMGPAKLFAGYMVTDPEGPVRYNGTNVGVSFKLGGGTLMGQWHNIKQASVSARGNAMALSYVYPLSKRTDVMVSGGVMSNNTTGTFQLRASDFQINPGAASADPKGVGFGVVHKF